MAADPQSHFKDVDNQRFALLLEAAPDAIMEVDRAGKIVVANSEAEQLFGWSRQELVGLPVEVLLPDRFRYRHVAHRDGYAAHPVRRPMGQGLGLYAVRKDGRIIAVDINLSPLQGELDGHVICIVRDVTERRKEEEEISALNRSLGHRSAELTRLNEELNLRNHEVERANRLKSEFLASMSHELRTPLNTILGFSELLSEQGPGPLNEKQMRFVGHIQRDARHLLELINDILDLSKIEAERLQLQVEAFPVAGAVAEVLSSIRPLAAAKSLTLEGEIDDELILAADRLRFKQILYNLLSNAIKFTPSGGRVWVETAVQQGRLQLVVGDTGMGIAPEDQKVIFESFRQASATTKGVREGTGLGLAITKRLVEHHGGKTWVESAPGRGSRFFVELPLGAAVEPLRTEDAREVAAAITTNGKTVLIADDNPLGRELVREALDGHVSTWLEAGDGREALEKIQECRPDLVLLDIQMPLLDGYQVVREIRRDPALKHLRVVALTAFAMQGDREKALAAGFDDYIAKPVTLAKLQAQLG